MKKQIKSIFSLFAICAVTALLLALTNALTSPIIKENEYNATQKALLEVMPSGKDFKLFLPQCTLPESVREVYEESGGGYVFKLEVSGYSSGMVIMCGVDANGAVSGAVCLASSETLGYEKKFGTSFAGKTADNVKDVDTVSGATRTTAAYRSAIADALDAFAKITATGGNGQ